MQLACRRWGKHQMQALRPSKPRGSCNVFPPSNDTVTFSWLDPTQSVYSSEATWNANVHTGEQDEEVQLIPKQTAAPHYAARFSRRFHDQRTTSCQKSTITFLIATTLNILLLSNFVINTKLMLKISKAVTCVF